jgi:hypothetical protein
MQAARRGVRRGGGAGVAEKEGEGPERAGHGGSSSVTGCWPGVVVAGMLARTVLSLVL